MNSDAQDLEDWLLHVIPECDFWESSRQCLRPATSQEGRLLCGYHERLLAKRLQRFHPEPRLTPKECNITICSSVGVRISGFTKNWLCEKHYHSWWLGKGPLL